MLDGTGQLTPAERLALWKNALHECAVCGAMFVPGYDQLGTPAPMCDGCLDDAARKLLAVNGG